MQYWVPADELSKSAQEHKGNGLTAVSSCLAERMMFRKSETGAFSTRAGF